MVVAEDSVAKAMNNYFSRSIKNEWRRFVPDIVKGNPALFALLIEPTTEVTRHQDPRHKRDALEITLLVDEPKNFQHQPHRISQWISTSDFMNYKLGAVDILKDAVLKIMAEYSQWVIRNVAKVPDGVLAVWDCEILPRESAKAYNLLKGEGTVRPKLGILLMEDENGAVSVQLFQSAETVKESYDNMQGKPGDPPSRVTMLNLNYDGEAVEAFTKNLPVLRDRTEDPDMHVLGTGPVKFNEGWEEEVKEAFKPFTQGSKS